MLRLIRRNLSGYKSNNFGVLMKLQGWDRSNVTSTNVVANKVDSTAGPSLPITGGGSANQGYPKKKIMSWALLPEVEFELNKQINNELNAAYSYMALAAYFESISVGLPSFAKLNEEQTEEEFEHARVIRNIITERGGKVKFCPIIPPSNQDWASPLDAMNTALEVENKNLQTVLDVLDLAAEAGDVLTTRILERHVVGADMDKVTLMQKYVLLLETAKNPVEYQLIDYNLGKELKNMSKAKE